MTHTKYTSKTWRSRGHTKNQIPRLYKITHNTHTIFDEKRRRGYLKSIGTNFQLHMTELEHEWRTQATTVLPQPNSELSLKLLHKLLTHNIHKIKHISLPNGISLMLPKDFQTYYKTPTKLEKTALHIVEQLICHPSCNQNYPNPCNRHPQARILKENYISENNTLTSRIQKNPPPQSTHQHNKNPLRFPIQTISNHKINEIKDKYKITKKINTYLCQWSLQNNTTYNK
jgi:hypothetical protein